MDNRSTKDRLEELQDLLQGGYISENEFRVSRINILRDGGIDVMNRRYRAGADNYEQDEETASRQGCGCFLISLLLIVAVAAGAFFAAPVWPAAYGGGYARTVREWVVILYEDFASYFSEEQPASPVLPADPSLASADAQPASPDLVPGPVSDDSVSAAPVVPAAAPRPQAPAARSAAENPSLPVLDSRAFALPDKSAPGAAPDAGPGNAAQEPNVVIVEIPSASARVAAPTEIGAPAEDASYRQGYVSVRNARIRSAPDTSTNDNVVGWGRDGDRFSIIEEEIGKDGVKWYNIRYEDGSKQGWISGTLVTLD